jgi:hypothetical protein
VAVVALAVGPAALHSAQATDRWDVSAYLTHRTTHWLATDDAYTVTLVESEHCPPDRFPGTIDDALVPPARASAYRCGEAWSIIVEHDSGASVLLQGSAGFVPGALAGRHADVAYLGVAQLGLLDEGYIRDYWAETVAAVGARRVVLTHWDDFFRPRDPPPRPRGGARRPAPPTPGGGGPPPRPPTPGARVPEVRGWSPGTPSCTVSWSANWPDSTARRPPWCSPPGTRPTWPW